MGCPAFQGLCKCSDYERTHLEKNEWVAAKCKNKKVYAKDIINCPLGKKPNLRRME
jgi:hypothetical protein